MQIAEDLNGNVAKNNVAVTLRWNGNSEFWNKEVETNIFWFKEKNDWLVGVEDWKRRLLDFRTRGQKWDVQEGEQVGFESLDLMTKKIEWEKLLWFVGEIDMEDLEITRILGLKKNIVKLNLQKNET